MRRIASVRVAAVALGPLTTPRPPKPTGHEVLFPIHHRQQRLSLAPSLCRRCLNSSSGSDPTWAPACRRPGLQSSRRSPTTRPQKGPSRLPGKILDPSGSFVQQMPVRRRPRQPFRRERRYQPPRPLPNDCRNPRETQRRRLGTKAERGRSHRGQR